MYHVQSRDPALAVQVRDGTQLSFIFFFFSRECFPERPLSNGRFFHAQILEWK
jgi:hypothetical protein